MPQGWFKGKVNKVTMEDWDRPDLFAEFQDIQSLPYGKTKELQKSYDGLDLENPNPETVEALFEVLISLLTEWNMEDPVTGVALPMPKVATDFDSLPMEVLAKIIEGAMGDSATAEVPKAKPTELVPS